MAGTITKKFTIQFAEAGLDVISKKIKEIGPILGESKADRKQIENLMNQINTLQAYIQKTGKELTSESAESFVQEYKNVLKDFAKIRKQFSITQDPQIESERTNLEQFIEKSENKIEELKKQLEISQKFTEKQGDSILPSSKMQQTAMDNLRVDPDNTFLQSRGDETEKYKTWADNIKKVKDIFEQLNIDSKKFTEDEEYRKQVMAEGLEQQLKAKSLRWDTQQITEQLLLSEKTNVEIQKMLNNETNHQKEIKKNILKEEGTLLKDIVRLGELEKKIAEELVEIDPTNASAQLGEEILSLTDQLKNEGTKAFEEYKKSIKGTNKEKKETQVQTKKLSGDFSNAAKNVFSYGLAFTALRRIYRETIRTVRDLDQALTEMAIVTTMSRQESWHLVGTFQELAKEVGFTTTEVAKLSTVYFRQGRALKDVIELTTVAAKAARVAGISALESANYLTAAVNGFGLAAKEAERTSDKFAALAASSASSYEELAVGLSKFAAQAKVAGLSMDFAIGLLAKGVETTREAPESIGTALKTVLARMREITDLGKTLEDGMDVSRVEGALKNVGVSLRDTNGQFRDMEQVITEVGLKWDTLNRNQQASVAVALAGTRQQSRLLAMFQDFDRTLELVNISQESAGATMAQHLEYMQGMEAAMTRLRTAWQQFIVTITNSELIIGIVRGIATGLEWFSNTLEKLGIAGKNAMIGIMLLAGSLKVYSMWQKIVNKNIKSSIVIATAKNALDRITNWIIHENIFAKKLEDKVIIQSNFIKLKAMSGNILYAISLIFVKKATDAATVATGIFGTTLMLTPIGWIAAGLAVVIGLFMLFRKGAKDSADGVDSFAGSLFDSFRGLFDAIKSIFNLIGGLISVIFNLFKSFAPILKTFASLDPLIVFFRAAILGIQRALQAVTIIFNIFSGAMNFLLSVVNKLLKPLQELGDGIKNFLQFDKMDSMMKKLVDRTKEWSKEMEDLNKSYSDINEELRKSKEANIAENYELGRKNQTIQKLVNSYDNLNKKRVLNEQDRQDLEELKAQIKDFEGGKFVISMASGDVDIEESLAEMRNFAEKNQAEIIANQRENAIDTLRLIRNDADAFFRDSSNLDLWGTYLNLGLDIDLNNKQKYALNKYYQELLEANKDALKRARTPEQQEALIQALIGDSQSFVKIFDDISDDIELYANNISDKINIYTNKLGELGDSPEAEALKNLFPELEYLFTQFGDKINEPKYQNLFENLGLDADLFNLIEESLERTTTTTEEFFDMIAIRQDELMQSGIESSVAFSQAWSEIASILEDASSRQMLYGALVKNTTLEIGQSLDNLTSKIDRVSEAQRKYMSGEFTQQELLEFIESYPEIFDNKELIQKFMQGRDISRFLREDINKTRQEYLKTLQNINAELTRKDLSENQRRQYEIQKLQLEVLINYGNELKAITRTQYEYNRLLDQQNILSKAGIENLELREALLKRSLDLLLENIERNGQEMRELSEDIEGLFTIINGVFIWNEDAVDQATDAIRERYQELLDSNTEYYLQYMNQSLENEKFLADKKKEIYQKYFDDLDRLERIRERKQTREKIIQQLQRLEGATDERSRQRAKELRKELIQIEERAAKETEKESRENLIKGIDESLERQRKALEEVFLEFINSFPDANRDAPNIFQEALDETLLPYLDALLTFLGDYQLIDPEFHAYVLDAFENGGALAAFELLNQIDLNSEKLAEVFHDILIDGGEEQAVAFLVTLRELGIPWPEGIRIKDLPVTAWDEIQERLQIQMPTADDFSRFNINLGNLLLDMLDFDDLESMLAALSSIFEENLIDENTYNSLREALISSFEDGGSILYSYITEAINDLDWDLGLNLLKAFKDAGIIDEDLYNTLIEERERDRQNRTPGPGPGPGPNIDSGSIGSSIGGYMNTPEGTAIIDEINYLANLRRLIDLFANRYISYQSFDMEKLKEMYPTANDLEELLEYVGTSPAPLGSLESLWDTSGIINKTEKIKHGNIFYSSSTRTDWAKEAWRDLIPGYKTGGLVSHTGFAMVHGSSSTPEAFLNAEQTALFANLRDILSSISTSSEVNNSSINIEQISISTNSLNTNQDFKRAGYELANAFNAAIGRRGINLNTKR